MMDHQTQRKRILEQMEQIDRMELGTLREEYRMGGNGEKRGPYFKHQVWKNGRNQSCRVRKEEAALMKEATEGYARFQELAGKFVDVTVAMTRVEESEHSKKNGIRSKWHSIRKVKSF